MILQTAWTTRLGEALAVWPFSRLSRGSREGEIVPIDIV